MKEYFKNIIVRALWWQVSRLRKKYNPIVIAVAGSIGKTGTKSAIAHVLSQHLKVQWQQGNYNDIVSVPLVFFGQKMPHLYNVFGWTWRLIVNEWYIQTNWKYDVVVLELGTDYKGNLKLFQQYVRADYGVLTGIAPEHMENFKNLDEVADEELTITEIADTILVNTDTVAKKYQQWITDPLTYGEGPGDCRITAKPINAQLHRPVVFTLKNGGRYAFETPLLGKQNLPALAAATLLADMLELREKEIMKGLRSYQASPGRMQTLKGIHGSLIIDDTYNASPEAAIAALDTLYEVPGKKKIALLGQMNELGSFSKPLHEQVGKHCDPKRIDLLVTIGADANNYLADTAEKRGCKVMRCPSPYHAADIILPFMKKDTVLLAKGSQNGVFAEEAVKELLANHADAKHLVRQSKKWRKFKEEHFA